jgi:predicted house-cleaning NTP pyrophosphatase (Maf/HAM1 superfamily)
MSFVGETLPLDIFLRLHVISRYVRLALPLSRSGVFEGGKRETERERERETRISIAKSSMDAGSPIFVIGSSSKWRLATMLNILRDPVASPCGVVPPQNVLQISPDIDEKSIRRPTAAELVMAIAFGKLEAVCAGLLASPQLWEDEALSTKSRDIFVFCSDQVAVYQGSEIREKPVDAAENRRFLEDYRHSSVKTVAGYVVKNISNGRTASAIGGTETFFGDIPDDVIEALIARGDTLMCCGGFAVDDADLAKCIVRMDGSVEQVAGIHREIVADLVRQVASSPACSIH